MNKTPLTDAEIESHGDDRDGRVSASFARSLELKLQEAEANHQHWRKAHGQCSKTREVFIEKLQEAESHRDEANNKCNSLREQLVQEEGKQTAMQAERDQLIKVVDELAYGIEAFRDFGCAKHGTHYDVMMKCYEAYSLLPHVKQKKHE